jgi:AraC-like DNA-binding protein
MPAPHMHSQVELNFVLEGAMRYRFEADEAEVSAGRLALFWGMAPHQVIDCAPGTRFVCLYAPWSRFLNLPGLNSLRDALFSGALAEAAVTRAGEADAFLRWRGELLGDDAELAAIAQDEIAARIRRVAREGWRDLRRPGSAQPARSRPPGAQLLKPLERMLRFVAEHGLDDVSAADVAAAAGLHPHYAAALFKRGTGLTIAAALLRQRLDTASALLVGTRMPVGAIAFESGFGSLSRFYEAFGRRFGMSPAGYRRKRAAANA